VTEPVLSILISTPALSATLVRPLRFLQRQTIRDRIELILLAPSETTFEDLDPALIEGYAVVKTLAVGSIATVEECFAPGIEAATSPVVALLENHVYPEPGWAEAIVRAHEGAWTIVGGAISVANPATATSWVEHLMSYVFHDELAPTGEVQRVSRNNSTFKRHALLAFGDRLDRVLQRDGGLMEELRSRGARSFRSPEARLYHLNPSKISALLNLRVHSARASASTRARVASWSGARRFLYVLASPLFPLLRLKALWPRLVVPPVRTRIFRVAPLLLLALLVDAFGQALGFSLGSGKSAAIAARYDLDRAPYLTAADRAEFMV
jgi:hypothetical protein